MIHETIKMWPGLDIEIWRNRKRGGSLRVYPATKHNIDRLLKWTAHNFLRIKTYEAKSTGYHITLKLR